MCSPESENTLNAAILREFYDGMPGCADLAIGTRDRHGEVASVPECDEATGQEETAVRPVLLEARDFFGHLIVAGENSTWPPDLGVRSKSFREKDEPLSGIALHKGCHVGLKSA